MFQPYIELGHSWDIYGKELGERWEKEGRTQGEKSVIVEMKGTETSASYADAPLEMPGARKPALNHLLSLHTYGFIELYL